MSKKSFKRVGELHDGINFCVDMYIARAKNASREARHALRDDRQGRDCFYQYLRYRAERSHWMHAARLLLKWTTNGVVTDVVERRIIANIVEAQKEVA
jgi:hypothetical protein